MAKFLMKNIPAMKLIRRTLKETPEGYLFFEYNGEWKKLFFKNGKVTGASSSNRSDYLVQYLILYEGINTDQFEEVYKTGFDTKKNLEEVLKSAAPEVLEQLVFEKIEDTIFIAANWPGCIYSVVEERQSKYQNVNVEISSGEILAGLKKRISEFDEITSFIPKLGAYPKIDKDKISSYKITNQEEVLLNGISAGKDITEIFSLMSPHNYLLFKCLLKLGREKIIVPGTGAPLLPENIVKLINNSIRYKKNILPISTDFFSGTSNENTQPETEENKYRRTISIFQKLHYNDPDDLIYSYCFMRAESCFIVQFYATKVSPFAVLEIADNIEKVNDANEIDIEIYEILKKEGGRYSLKNIVKSIQNRNEVDVLVSTEKLMLKDVIREIKPETFFDAVKLGKKEGFEKLLKKSGINEFFTPDVSENLTPSMLSAITHINCDGIAEGEENTLSTMKPTLNDYEMTLLMFASMVGNYEAVDFLLMNRADPNIRNDNGITALMLALKNGYDDIAMLLMKNGADVNARNNNNYSALMIAVSNGMSETVDYMIKLHVDVNHLNSRKQTALNIALDFNYNNIAVSLIAAGTDLNIEDLDGHTPLYYAESVEMTELIEKGLKNSKKTRRKLNERRNDFRTPARNLLKDEKEVIPGSFPVFIFAIILIATSLINIKLFFFSAEDRYGLSSQSRSAMEQLGMEYCNRFKACRKNVPEHVMSKCNQMGTDIMADYFKYAKSCDMNMLEECKSCIRSMNCKDFYELSGSNLSEYCYQCINVCKYRD